MGIIIPCTYSKCINIYNYNYNFNSNGPRTKKAEFVQLTEPSGSEEKGLFSIFTHLLASTVDPAGIYNIIDPLGSIQHSYYRTSFL